MKQEAHGSQRSPDSHGKLEKIYHNIITLSKKKKSNFCADMRFELVNDVYIRDLKMSSCNLQILIWSCTLHVHACSWQDPMYMYMIMKKIKSQYLPQALHNIH